jgi:hypothetical protein
MNIVYFKNNNLSYFHLRISEKIIIYLLFTVYYYYYYYYY